MAVLLLGDGETARRRDGETARRRDGETARKSVVEEAGRNTVLSPLPLSEALPNAEKRAKGLKNLNFWRTGRSRFFGRIICD